MSEVNLEKHKDRLRAHSRYPYTFACDWLRSAGVAESRADASVWRQAYAKVKGIEDVDAATEFAEEYVNYYAILDYAEDVKVKAMAHLLSLPSPLKE